MKKIILSIGILVSAISFTSCEKDLEIKPFDSVVTDDNTYVTKDEYDQGIRGIYSNMRYEGYYGGTMYIIPDVTSDNLIINQNGRQSERTPYSWLYNSNNTPGPYYTCYSAINRANTMLEALENFNGLEDDKNNFKGEALALRAMSHFDILRYYAKIPTQSADANQSIGIAYVTEVDALQTPARINVAESYALVIQDLKDALTMIAANNGVGRFNTKSVNALLSRVYLYAGQYQNAIDAANEVNDVLATGTAFQGIWNDTSETEVLLKFVITAEDNIAIGTSYSQSSSAGIRSEYVFDYDFFLEFLDSDIRKASYLIEGDWAGSPYNNVRKWYGKDNNSNGEVDAKAIRYGEVVLNKAEAYFFIGNETEALNSLNELRVARGLAEFSGSGDLLLNEIKLQRRLDLAFEGHRFFDIKRWGESIIRSNKGDKADGTGTPALVRELPAGDHRFQLPISLGAIQANPNLEQNPGY
ncbi:RagB/SusD family nutrient uptake outer membrane protein [Aureivirga sp. CE67]|uniref:RagB/SusD family nutrient uptake outer membrane protein n=1 Tax=Aureivirga sp. CE67 TaxID=1788983 RepID=UPI0018CBAAB4|nr:RagB/SusD family nutrient uptake outer membrane protein [Aureivirga sp. CE67]